MSVSKECGTCPFNEGFDVKPSEVLTACGDPSQRCINLREGLVDQLAAWNRYMGLAKTASNGVLALELLQPSTILDLTSTKPGESISSGINRFFRMKVIESSDQGLRGEVLIDSYNESVDERERTYAVPRGDEVEIHGAFERHTDDWRGARVPGELHVGRFVYYTPEGLEGQRQGLYLQEVTIIDIENNFAFHIFGTDPSAHRYGPRIQKETQEDQ